MIKSEKPEKSGVYKTKQRDLVLSCIQNREKEHITADEICAILRQAGTPVGKSTVYRYLNLLVEDGTVIKYVVEEGMPACYQYVGCKEACHSHYHLKCSSCGKLFHIESTVLDALDESLKQQFAFILDHTKTVLYGECGHCTKQKLSY